MIDQAARLREIATEIKTESVTGSFVRPRSRVIAVTSGKGGVGKTNIAVNMAMKLREYNNRVLLIDADTNLANADIILGISPHFSLSDALVKDYPIKDVISTGPGGIHFLPGGSGLVELLELPDLKQKKILHQLERLESRYDYLILDTPAGLNKQLLDYLSLATQVFVIATPEPTSIADAYAVVKVLSLKQEKLPQIRFIINQAKTEEHGREIYSKLKMVIDKFLQVNVRYLGTVQFDKRVSEAVIRQKPFSAAFPKSDASRCLDIIIERIITRSGPGKTGNEESFFSKLKKISILN
ncbi:MinD/ParA family protein [candidate division KSB1 bacterium]